MVYLHKISPYLQEILNLKKIKKKNCSLSEPFRICYAIPRVNNAPPMFIWVNYFH